MIKKLGPDYQSFLNLCGQIHEPTDIAYQVFGLIRQYSKSIVQSAIRETLNSKSVHLRSLIQRLQPNDTSSSHTDPIFPRNSELLRFDYKRRPLSVYEPKL